MPGPAGIKSSLPYGSIDVELSNDRASRRASLLEGPNMTDKCQSAPPAPKASPHAPSVASTEFEDGDSEAGFSITFARSLATTPGRSPLLQGRSWDEAETPILSSLDGSNWDEAETDKVGYFSSNPARQQRFKALYRGKYGCEMDLEIANSGFQTACERRPRAGETAEPREQASRRRDRACFSNMHWLLECVTR